MAKADKAVGSLLYDSTTETVGARVRVGNTCQSQGTKHKGEHRALTHSEVR
jgi:hypothetical protein